MTNDIDKYLEFGKSLITDFGAALILALIVVFVPYLANMYAGIDYNTALAATVAVTTIVYNQLPAGSVNLYKALISFFNLKVDESTGRKKGDSGGMDLLVGFLAALFLIALIAVAYAVYYMHIDVIAIAAGIVLTGMAAATAYYKKLRGITNGATITIKDPEKIPSIPAGIKILDAAHVELDLSLWKGASLYDAKTDLPGLYLISAIKDGKTVAIVNAKYDLSTDTVHVISQVTDWVANAFNLPDPAQKDDPNHKFWVWTEYTTAANPLAKIIERIVADGKKDLQTLQLQVCFGMDFNGLYNSMTEEQKANFVANELPQAIILYMGRDAKQLRVDADAFWKRYYP